MAIKYNKDGLLKKIEKLNSLNNSRITFGIFGKKAKEIHNDSYLSVGAIAKIHEEGRTIRYPNGARLTFQSQITGEYRTIIIPPGGQIVIPARAFFFNATVTIKANLLEIFRRQFKLLWANSNSVDNFLKQVGEFCKQKVQDEIGGTQFQKLSELQIFRKGFIAQLTEQGQLYNAIDYQVKKDMRMKANKK